MSQLVIFDCDGVLVDSETISNDVLARMLSAEGLATTLAQARRDYQGLLLGDVLERAQAKLGHPLPDDWLSRYEHERTDAFELELEPVRGAPAVLERLAREGLARCVASQGKLAKTRLSLELTGLRRFFEDGALFSAEEVLRGKPYPDLFLHAASVMGADPDRCVVIEDTPSGVTAASCAGMRVLGYAADSDRSALERAGAEIFDSLDQLPRLLGLTENPP
jgi:HAD superfamily hydrolase (TIGR01509 family)